MNRDIIKEGFKMLSLSYGNFIVLCISAIVAMDFDILECSTYTGTYERSSCCACELLSKIYFTTSLLSTVSIQLCAV